MIIIYFNNLLLVYKIFQINDLIASLYAFLRRIFWASPISSKLCNIGINDTFRICSDWSVLGSVLYTHTQTALSVDSILLVAQSVRVGEENMAIYRTRCDVCSSEFNITTALIKHREAKHSGAQAITFLKSYKGQEIIEPSGPKKKGRRSAIYKLWVGGIVESINSCLLSKAMGK